MKLEQTFLNEIGRKMRIIRASEHIQQKQLAKKAKVSSSTISQIESGLKSPSLSTLIKIAIALDTYPHWFLEPTQEIVNSFRKDTK